MGHLKKNTDEILTLCEELKRLETTRNHLEGKKKCTFTITKKIHNIVDVLYNNKILDECGHIEDDVEENLKSKIILIFS